MNCSRLRFARAAAASSSSRSSAAAAAAAAGTSSSSMRQRYPGTYERAIAHIAKPGERTEQSSLPVPRRWVRNAGELCIDKMPRSANSLTQYLATYKFRDPQWMAMLNLPCGNPVSLELRARHAGAFLKYHTQKGHAFFAITDTQHTVIHPRGLAERSLVSISFGKSQERLAVHMVHEGPIDAREPGGERGIVASSISATYSGPFERRSMLWQRSRRVGAMQAKLGAYDWTIFDPADVGRQQEEEVMLLQNHTDIVGSGVATTGIVSSYMMARHPFHYVSDFEAPSTTVLDAVQQSGYLVAKENELVDDNEPLHAIAWSTSTQKPYLGVEIDLPFVIHTSKPRVYGGEELLQQAAAAASHDSTTSGTPDFGDLEEKIKEGRRTQQQLQEAEADEKHETDTDVSKTFSSSSDNNTDNQKSTGDDDYYVEKTSQSNRTRGRRGRQDPSRTSLVDQQQQQQQALLAAQQQGRSSSKSGGEENDDDIVVDGSVQNDDHTTHSLKRPPQLSNDELFKRSFIQAPTSGAIGQPLLMGVPIMNVDYFVRQGANEYVYDSGEAFRGVNWWSQKSLLPYSGSMWMCRDGFVDHLRPIAPIRNPFDAYQRRATTGTGATSFSSSSSSTNNNAVVATPHDRVPGDLALGRNEHYVKTKHYMSGGVNPSITTGKGRFAAGAVRGGQQPMSAGARQALTEQAVSQRVQRSRAAVDRIANQKKQQQQRQRPASSASATTPASDSTPE